jgi:phosphoesterase RecJ-like protein
MELSEHQFKLSFRSKGKVSVERIAGLFGGGGHINAAACYINGDFENVLHRVLKAIEELSFNP